MLQKSQNTYHLCSKSKSPKSLGSRGLQIPKPLLEAQIYRKLKTPQNVRSLRILGVDYGTVRSRDDDALGAAAVARRGLVRGKAAKPTPETPRHRLSIGPAALTGG